MAGIDGKLYFGGLDAILYDVFDVQGSHEPVGGGNGEEKDHGAAVHVDVFHVVCILRD